MSIRKKNTMPAHNEGNMSRYKIAFQGTKFWWRSINGKTLDSASLLYRKYKSVVRGIADFTATVVSPPMFHVTLLITTGGDWLYDINAAKILLKAFARKFSKKFPTGWFLHKLEYSPTSGVHLHLLMRLDKERTLSSVSRNLAKWWENLTGSDEPNLCEVVEFSRNHYGYFTSPKKRANTMFLLSLMEGRRIWGVVNRKAAGVEVAEEYDVTREEFDTIRDKLAELLDDDTTTESHRLYLDNDNGSLYYVKKGIQKKALRSIGKGKKGK